MVQTKFNAKWPNLNLELHHCSSKLDKEGFDEFDHETTLCDLNSVREVALTLSNETIAATAMRLFGQSYGGRAFILRDRLSVEEKESLAYCNSPFRLPLNEFSYREFKRRFTHRWPNLSIELYDTTPNQGGLGAGLNELAEDFEMKTLSKVGDALHDYIFISDWGNSLKRGNLAAEIKNKRLGISCERNEIFKRLKDFHAL